MNHELFYICDMNTGHVIRELENNAGVFSAIFSGLSSDLIHWRQSENKWSILEIACHLYDEEREDFRARLRHILENRIEPLTPIDPPGWVLSRNYASKNLDETVKAFIKERNESVNWLRSYKEIQLDNFYIHPKFGNMTAKMFLANWLAHDYLHIRQILRLKYDFLKNDSGEALDYAGPAF